LNAGIRLQIEKNNSGGAVNIFRTIAGIKKIMNDTRKFKRESAGARKLCFTADCAEIIFLEKDNNFIWR